MMKMLAFDPCRSHPWLSTCRSEKARRFVEEALRSFPESDASLLSVIAAIDRQQMRLLADLSDRAVDDDERADAMTDLNLLMGIKTDIRRRIVAFLSEIGLDPAEHVAPDKLIGAFDLRVAKAMTGAGDDPAVIAGVLAVEPSQLRTMLESPDFRALEPAPEEVIPMDAVPVRSRDAHPWSA
jgi:hypothetical protein